MHGARSSHTQRVQGTYATSWPVPCQYNSPVKSDLSTQDLNHHQWRGRGGVCLAETRSDHSHTPSNFLTSLPKMAVCGTTINIIIPSLPGPVEVATSVTSQLVAGNRLATLHKITPKLAGYVSRKLLIGATMNSERTVKFSRHLDGIISYRKPIFLSGSVRSEINRTVPFH